MDSTQGQFSFFESAQKGIRFEWAWQPVIDACNTTRTKLIVLALFIDFSLRMILYAQQTEIALRLQFLMFKFGIDRYGRADYSYRDD